MLNDAPGILLLSFIIIQAYEVHIDHAVCFIPAGNISFPGCQSSKKYSCYGYAGNATVCPYRTTDYALLISAKAFPVFISM